MCCWACAALYDLSYMARARRTRFVAAPSPLLLTVKSALLQRLSSEPSHVVCRRLAETVSVVTLSLVKAGESCEAVLAAALQLANLPTAPQRVAGLVILARLAEPGDAALVVPHLAQVKPLLLARLSDNEVVVQTEAVRVVTTLLGAASQPAIADALGDALPALLQVLGGVLETDESAGQEVLKCLIDVVHLNARIVKPCIAEIGRAMLTLAQEQSLDTDTRALALEFLVQLTEKAPSAVRKVPELVDAVLSLAVFCIMDVEDDDSWALRLPDETSYSGDITEDDKLAAAGEQSFERAAVALGGRTVFPRLIALLAEPLHSENWRHRRGALVALALAGEGCASVMRPQLAGLCEGVIRFCADAHLRVRFAAALCLGQWAIDFGEDPLASAGSSHSSGALKERRTFQAVFGRQAIKALLDMGKTALGTAERLAAFCCDALVNVLRSDFCKVTDIGDVRELLLAVAEILQGLQHDVTKQHAVSVIASVASLINEDFAQYYRDIMPLVVAVFEKAVHDSRALAVAMAGAEAVDTASSKRAVALRSVRNKALEALALAAGSAGPAVAGEDAARVMALLVEATTNNEGAAPGASLLGESDDPESFRYMTAALARLFVAMPALASEYLPKVLPLLLRESTQEIPTMVLDVDDPSAMADAHSSGLDLMTVHLPGKGERLVATDSNAVQSKAVAATMLFNCLSEVSPSVFAGHAADVVAAVEHLITNRQVEAARLAGATAGLYAVRVAMTAGAEAASGALLRIVAALLESLRQETDRDNVDTLSECLAATLKVGWDATQEGDASAPRLPLDQLPALYEACCTSLASSLALRMQVISAANEADADLTEEETLKAIALEESHMTNVIDAIGYALKCAGPAGWPAASSKLVPTFLPVLALTGPVHNEARTAALCNFDDLLEYCGPESAALLPKVVPALVTAMGEDDPLLRQAGVFGAGVCAAHHGAALTADMVEHMVQGLIAAVRRPDAREEDHGLATDNAVSALRHFAVAMPGHPAVQRLGGAGALIKSVVECLPLREDGIEARGLHGWFFEQAAAAVSGQATLLEGVEAALILHKISQCVVAHFATLQEHGGDEEAKLLSDRHLQAVPELLRACKAALGASWDAVVSGFTAQERAVLQ